MKVLILSSNNGGGHNSVAKAIQECYEAHGDACEIRDCLSFISDGVSEVVAKSHNFVYRHAPELFDSSYRRSEQNMELFKENHGARRMIDLGKFNLGQFVRKEGYELVICTHVFAAMMLTAAKNHYDLAIRTAIVETDYANTPGSADNEMDIHFLPDESLVLELIASGVEERKIVISGIPIRKEIAERTEKAEAKLQTGLDPEHKHVLIMGGSMGCGPIPDILAGLYSAVDADTDISVVCGTNERMLAGLKADYGQLSNIHLYGYVPQISLLMDSADLLMTKPGGISTSEAAAKALPMVLINAVAGCEGHNLDFFLQKGGAVTAETAEGLCQCCLDLLSSEELRIRMLESLSRLAKVNAAETIYQTLSVLPALTDEASEDLVADAALSMPVTMKPMIPKVQIACGTAFWKCPGRFMKPVGFL